MNTCSLRLLVPCLFFSLGILFAISPLHADTTYTLGTWVWHADVDYFGTRYATVDTIGRALISSTFNQPIFRRLEIPGQTFRYVTLTDDGLWALTLSTDSAERVWSGWWKIDDRDSLPDLEPVESNLFPPSKYWFRSLMLPGPNGWVEFDLENHTGGRSPGIEDLDGFAATSVVRISDDTVAVVRPIVTGTDSATSDSLFGAEVMIVDEGSRRGVARDTLLLDVFGPVGIASIPERGVLAVTGGRPEQDGETGVTLWDWRTRKEIGFLPHEGAHRVTTYPTTIGTFDGALQKIWSRETLELLEEDSCASPTAVSGNGVVKVTPLRTTLLRLVRANGTDLPVVSMTDSVIDFGTVQVASFNSIDFGEILVNLHPRDTVHIAVMGDHDSVGDFLDFVFPWTWDTPSQRTPPGQGIGFMSVYVPNDTGAHEVDLQLESKYHQDYVPYYGSPRSMTVRGHSLARPNVLGFPEDSVFYLRGLRNQIGISGGLQMAYGSDGYEWFSGFDLTTGLRDWHVRMKNHYLGDVFTAIRLDTLLLTRENPTTTGGRVLVARSLRTGEVVRSTPLPPERGVIVSPDGTMYLSYTSLARPVTYLTVHSYPDDHELYSFEGDLSPLTFSHDGRYVSLQKRTEPKLHVIDLSDLSTRMFDLTDRGLLYEVEITEEQDRVIVVTAEMIEAYSLATGEKTGEIEVYRRDKNPVLDIDPSGDLAVVALSDSSFGLYLTSDLSSVGTVDGIAGQLRFAAFSPDGDRLAVTSGAPWDQTLLIYDVDDLSLLADQHFFIADFDRRSGTGGTGRPMWLPDGERVMIHGDHTLAAVYGASTAKPYLEILPPMLSLSEVNLDDKLSFSVRNIGPDDVEFTPQVSTTDSGISVVNAPVRLTPGEMTTISVQVARDVDRDAYALLGLMVEHGGAMARAHIGENPVSLTVPDLTSEPPSVNGVVAGSLIGTDLHIAIGPEAGMPTGEPVIVDMQGRTSRRYWIRSDQGEERCYTTTIHDLPSGTYFVVVSSANGSWALSFSLRR